ncbi:DUF2293 domain-containing protein [Aspergillus candidus]|uniref:DUF2293 domain-containing protein n=1 Tax=Aspergillus candidus TaxID=41067 RepID=A0A2I2EZH1_ASPCN|nr:hypothetical protein BDW47DRAFT_129649 [Aspergillus candidus]PLB33766.1 hypothetical protein BDW47DRAFT_129649 [Aspergillus candidus]
MTPTMRSPRRKHTRKPHTRGKSHPANRSANRSILSDLGQTRKNSLSRGRRRGGSLVGVAGISKRSPVRGTSNRRAQAQKYARPPKLPPCSEPFEVNCFEHDSFPDGYVFVPRGDVYITRNCRAKTKQSHRIVHLVWDRSAKIKLGIRVPADVHAAVLELASATADSRANATMARDEKDLAHSQQLLRSQFPLMPDESMKIILDHAFRKGSGRVGRSSNLTDHHKATLAVEAHIRHALTPYEDLLRAGVKRQTARHSVWGMIQSIKETWEGCGACSSQLRPFVLPLRSAA